jgi:hypothetical protein
MKNSIFGKEREPFARLPGRFRQARLAASALIVVAFVFSGCEQSTGGSSVPALEGEVTIDGLGQGGALTEGQLLTANVTDLNAYNESDETAGGGKYRYQWWRKTGSGDWQSIQAEDGGTVNPYTLFNDDVNAAIKVSVSVAGYEGSKESEPTGTVAEAATHVYRVRTGTFENGGVSAQPATAQANDTVTLTVSPSLGYRLKADSLQVKHGSTPITTTSGGNTFTFTMPAANVTVTAEFEPLGQGNFSITIGSLQNGSIQTDRMDAASGATVTLTPRPDAGYKYKAGSLEVTKADGSKIEPTGANDTYTFTMPASHVTVTALFEPVPYTITIDTSIEHGTVTASAASAPVGQTVTLTAAPDTGYRLTADSPKVNGVTVSGSGPYTFTMPAGPVTVTAQFELVPYAVTIDSMTNGTVIPSAPSAVMGQTVTLTVNPSGGYKLKDNSLQVKHGSTTINPTASGGNIYTFTMPAVDVTVTAQFDSLQSDNYTISVGSLPGGSVASDKGYAAANAEVTLTVTPYDGHRYTQNSLTVTKMDGSKIETTGAGNTYTFTMPADHVTITAEFAAIPYLVTIVPGISGGTVTATVNGESAETATIGQTVTLTVTPLTGYSLVGGSLTVTGTNPVQVSGGGGTYTFTMPAANVTLAAEFQAIQYTIAIAGGITGGAVTSSVSSATVGQTVTLTVTPNTGYRLTADSFKVNGVTVSGSGPYTFTMPAGNVTVTAQFESVPYSIAIDGSIEHGAVTASAASATVGQTVTLTVTPASEYRLAEDSLAVIKADDSPVAVNGSGPYTFTMPASPVTVTARFVPASGGDDGVDVTINITLGGGDEGIFVDGDDVTIYKGNTDDEHPGSFTATVQSGAGYSAIQWYLDNNLLSGSDTTITINAADYLNKRYSLTVRVIKDGVPYSAEIYFTVATN